MTNTTQTKNPRYPGRNQKGWYKRSLMQKEAENHSFPYENPYLIYVLVSSDAPTNIRYVGYTSMKLNLRYIRHVVDAGKRKSNKDKWVNEILTNGHKLIMVVIEDGIQTKSDACDAERAYIKGFRDAGAELTNMTRGGVGTDGLAHKAETKEKQRQARLRKVEERRVVQMCQEKLVA
ncbi:GIY-YIG nuclease family protein [Segetibacter aerophilus]|nr:GIY-YIG nuclease family protein [Segetibacter aerophilus]